MTDALNVSSLIQFDNQAANTAVTRALGFTVTAGRDLFFQCTHWDVNTINLASVVIGGTAATLVVRGASGQFRDEQWVAKNVAGSDNNIVITTGASSSSNYLSGGVTEWTGGLLELDTGTPNTATGTSTSPAASTAISTSQANTIIMASVATQASSTNVGLSGPAGWTAGYTEQDNSNHIGGRGARIEETTTGTKTATFSQSASSAWVVVISAWKIIGGGGDPAGAIYYWRFG